MMGRSPSWARLLVAGVTITSVAQTVAQDASCVTDYDGSAGIDYFPDKVEIKYATTFSVEYFPSYKVLNTTLGNQTTTYVLYQCGTPLPDMGGMEVQEYFSVPVSRVATGTSDHIPRIEGYVVRHDADVDTTFSEFNILPGTVQLLAPPPDLELLGERDTIKAYTGSVQYVVSPCLHEGVEDGSIVETTMIHDECFSSVNNSALMELDIEVTFGDDLDIFALCTNNSEPLYNGVGVYSYAERGPNSGLAEGEAIKLFSLFYNAEEKGNEVFEEIEDLWSCTTSNAQGCSLRLNDVPEVAWFSYVPTYSSSSNFAGGWGAPKSDAFYDTAISNGGGSLVLCPPLPGTPSLMTDEEMVDCFKDAPICVFAAHYTEVEAVMNATALEQLACVQNGNVYDITLSSINAWFEAKTVEPHVLLEDMVVVLHGDDFNYGIGDYERLLLRNVETEESGSGAYYSDEGCPASLDAHEVRGECEYIIDFTTCDTYIESDGFASPASRAIPSTFTALWAVATFVGAIMISI